MLLSSLGRRFRAPAFWDAPNLVSDAILPLAVAFSAATRLREAIVAPPVVVTAPVICVGSVLVGGSGKTPVALAIGERLLSKDPTRRVHFLSRGYGGAAAGPLLVSPKEHCAHLVGDEPLLLAEVAPTWVAARRCDAAAAACRHGADLLIMDDGLQHTTLYRDLSLLCIDSGYLLGNRRVLPAGPLREPASRGYAKADAVIAIAPVSSGVNGMPSASELRKRLGLPDALPLLRARLEPEPTAASRLRGQRIIAFSGTAHPARFFDTLRTLGCEFVRTPCALPDHAPIDDGTFSTLREAAQTAGATLATTSKDAARLSASQRRAVEVLPISLKWIDGAETDLDRLIGQLSSVRARGTGAQKSVT